MEQIRQAVERAGARQSASVEQAGQAGTIRPQLPAGVADARTKEVALSSAYLESMRLIAHDPTDPRSRSFDMLRTQVLQAMDLKRYQFIAVTSPTPGCGKTLTAINLALSIARQPERSVLLVDLDLQKPQVSHYLGVSCEQGIHDVLEGRIALLSAVIQARIGTSRLLVLPNQISTPHSSEWMVSSAMRALLQEIKRNYSTRIVILDLPPMLSSDDVIALLPQLDCVLLVAAVGISTVPQIEECSRHLQSADVVRMVLNKVPERTTNYSY